MPSTPNLPEQPATPTNPGDAPPAESKTPASQSGTDASALAQTTPEHRDRAETKPGRDSLGMYQLLGELARGGMGIVYKARHVVLDRIVALKVMRADARIWPQDEERFQREMRAAARLHHPHILPIYEIGWQEGQPFYTMPFVVGGSLADLRGRWSSEPRTVLELMIKVARAVQHAHEQGIVHRDLKPANVLLDEHGEPQVSDFGLAKMVDDNVELTQTGAVLGTPGYMAPEQAAGQTRRIGPHTDVWALGVILYEIVTGRRPFVGDSTEEVKDRIRHAAPPRPRKLRPDLARPLERIILKCLEKDPERRYASAAEVADDIERYLRGERPQVSPSPRLWRRAVAIALTLGVVGLLAVATAAFWPRQQAALEPPPAESELPQPIVLLDENTAPADPHWLAGEKWATMQQQPPGVPLLLNNKFRISLLQLRSSPPWPHYRIEATVRAEEIKRFSDAGIFFAYTPLQTGRGLHHTFWQVGFEEVVRGYGEVELSAGVLQDFSPYEFPGGSPFEDLSHRFRFPSAKKAPGPLRQLAVEVDAQEVRAYWGDVCIRNASYQQCEEYSKVLPTRIIPLSEKVVGRFDSQGALGVYVSQGPASFHRVVLKPLR